MACEPSKVSDQPGHPPNLIRVFAVRMKKAWVLSYPLSAQRSLWSDRADAQADLSLRWAHSHFVGFVMSWLNYTLEKYMNYGIMMFKTSPVMCLSLFQYHNYALNKETVKGFIKELHLYASCNKGKGIMSCRTTKPTRLSSAWASTQIEQSLLCALSVAKDPVRTAKTLIRLGRCPCWSVSSLGVQSLCWFCHVAAHFVIQ